MGRAELGRRRHGRPPLEARLSIWPEPSSRRLRRYADKVSADPENAKWVAEARERIARGIPESQLIGHEELEHMRQAAKRRP